MSVIGLIESLFLFEIKEIPLHLMTSRDSSLSLTTHDATPFISRFLNAIQWKGQLRYLLFFEKLFHLIYPWFIDLWNFTKAYFIVFQVSWLWPLISPPPQKKRKIPSWIIRDIFTINIQGNMSFALIELSRTAHTQRIHGSAIMLIAPEKLFIFYEYFLF